MNRHTAIAAIAIAAAAATGTAFADDITMEPHPFVSTLTRAQVQEELRQFRSAGVNPWADDYDQLAAVRSDSSRADITAVYLADRDLVAAFNGEDSGSTLLARMLYASMHRPATALARNEIDQ